MKLPSAEDFVNIIEQKAFGSLATLNNFRFLSDENGKIWFHKSRHAIVFKAEYLTKLYAIRFFLNDDVEFFRRYHEIENHLEKLNVSWKVPFHFLKEEFYPVVKMDWVDGVSLMEYIDLIISQPLLINQLQSKLIALNRDLEEYGIGHGNLNLNHIRFVKHGQDYSIKLIDYDSMFIPPFRDRDSLSAGTSSFQHPMRLTSDFSETIDRFSFWVLLAALEAYKTDISLWKEAGHHGYDNSKQLLFNYRDLANPQQSRAFQILRNYKNDVLNFYTDKLFQFCTSKTLVSIEAPHLYHSNNSFVSRRKENNPNEIRSHHSFTQKEEAETIAPVLQRSSLRNQTASLPYKETIKETEVAGFKSEKRSGTTKPVAVKTKKKTSVLIFIAIAILVISGIYIITSKNQSTKSTSEIQTPTKKAESSTTTALVQKPTSKETVFTQANITQFLFNLYQSYNKRELPSILSNYTDSLSEYYDAKAVTKDKLNTIIKDLFIKPAYYECQPDLRSLQYNVQQNVCKLSVDITETIKADRRSKAENYSSKIEYVVDTTFKILSEKNVQ